jgi:folate-binding protein YgfZ
MSKEFLAGYEALRTGVAWLGLSERGIIRATGEDRVRLFHAMATNDIESLQAGQGCYTFFLSAQGRVLADANLFVLEDSLLLDTEPEIKQKLAEHLDKYIIADDVTLSQEFSQWAVIGVEGPESSLRLTDLGVPTPPNRWEIAPWRDGFIANVSAAAEKGYRILVPISGRAELIGALEQAGTKEADAQAIKVVRLENGKPRYGEDITERHLAQETAQMHAIAFGKGCYLGQEIVERVRSRAQIHRILNPLRIRTSQPPASGTKLTRDGTNAGEITSAAYSPAFEEVVALAYLRVEVTQAKGELAVEGSDPAATAYIPA